MEQGDSDKDLGGEDMIHQPNASTGGHHIILITNLENNLSPSIIEQFIHKHTSILPEVLVFPSQSSVPYASGAICLDSETKLEKIFKFLLNSEHMIISARGRPWVITGKMFNKSNMRVRILKFEYEGESGKSNMSRELKVVRLGTEAYKRAAQLRELFMDFMDHMNRIHNRLALEEAKILQ